MAGEVITIHADQQPPDSWDACMLVGGPVPGPSSSDTLWRARVVALLRERWTSDGRLVVLLPETSSGTHDDDDLIDWYGRAVDVADIAMFWWPDDTDPRLLATSLAAWTDGQRVIHGTPSHLPQSRCLRKYAKGHTMSTASTLADMVSAALDKIGSGAH